MKFSASWSFSQCLSSEYSSQRFFVKQPQHLNFNTEFFLELCHSFYKNKSVNKMLTSTTLEVKPKLFVFLYE